MQKYFHLKEKLQKCIFVSNVHDLSYKIDAKKQKIIALQMETKSANICFMQMQMQI